MHGGGASSLTAILFIRGPVIPAVIDAIADIASVNAAIIVTRELVWATCREILVNNGENERIQGTSTQPEGCKDRESYSYHNPLHLSYHDSHHGGHNDIFVECSESLHTQMLQGNMCGQLEMGPRRKKMVTNYWSLSPCECFNLFAAVSLR